MSIILSKSGATIVTLVATALTCLLLAWQVSSSGPVLDWLASGGACLVVVASTVLIERARARIARLNATAGHAVGKGRSVRGLGIGLCGVAISLLAPPIGWFVRDIGPGFALGTDVVLSLGILLVSWTLFHMTALSMMTEAQGPVEPNATDMEEVVQTWEPFEDPYGDFAEGGPLAPPDDPPGRTAMMASNERPAASARSMEGHYVQNAGPVASTFLSAYLQFDGPFAGRENSTVQAAAMDTVMTYPDCASAWLVLASADQTGPSGRLALVDRGLVALDSIERDRRYDVVVPHLFLDDARKDLLLLGIDACEALADTRRAAELSMILLRVTGWSDQTLVGRALALTALAGDDEAMAEIHRNRPRTGSGSGPDTP